MIDRVIVDTGPLVAFLDADDAWHSWVMERFRELASPLFTVEPVLTEACFLLKKHPAVCDDLLAMVAAGAIQIPFHLETEAAEVGQLCMKYLDLPMSLADACLVRLAEKIEGSRVFTLDSDFTIYRKHGRALIPLIYPKL